MAAPQAVIFDLDGTLTRSNLNFDEIRAEIGVQGPILEALEALDEDGRRRALEILERHERTAADRVVLQDDAVVVLATSRRRGLKTALLTRNSRSSVEVIAARHGLVFDAIHTRDDGTIKPSPEPVLSLCARLGTRPQRTWVVGDYLFDLQAGRAANAPTVLMVGEAPLPAYAALADHVIRKLTELLDLLEAC